MCTCVCVCARVNESTVASCEGKWLVRNDRTKESEADVARRVRDG